MTAYRLTDRMAPMTTPVFITAVAGPSYSHVGLVAYLNGATVVRTLTGRDGGPAAVISCPNAAAAEFHMQRLGSGLIGAKGPFATVAEALGDETFVYLVPQAVEVAAMSVVEDVLREYDALTRINDALAEVAAEDIRSHSLVWFSVVETMAHMGYDLAAVDPGELMEAVLAYQSRIRSEMVST